MRLLQNLEVIMAKTHLSAAKREELTFYKYISPWILGFLAFTLLPMIVSLVFSLTRVTVLGLGRTPTKFIGFDNYIRVFTKDTLFVKSIFTTFYYSFFRVLICVFLSLLLALLLNQKLKGRNFFRTMIYMPAVIPIVGSALLWQLLFSNDMSLFNYAFSFLGIAPVKWLNYDHALWSVLLMSIWCGLGPTMTILLAALQGVPQDLIEAAEMDGCGPVRKLFHIIIPMISSSLLYVCITGFIGALQAYGEMKLLTGGGPGGATTTMTMQVVSNAFSNDGLGMGYASAQAWVIFGVTIIFTAIFFKVTDRHVYYAGGRD